MAQSSKSQKRIINLNTLPNEPTDGSGRVCIHLFVIDERNGSFVEPHVLHPGINKHKVEARPARGRLACNPKRLPIVVTKAISGNRIITITPRTDDPRAVTCPACITSNEYKSMMERLEKKE